MDKHEAGKMLIGSGTSLINELNVEYILPRREHQNEEEDKCSEISVRN